MLSEEWQQRRQLCIAQMAATLEAGDRAATTDGQVIDATHYAKRATALFNAVDELEATAADAKYDEIDQRDR